jgi:hypothetical protein
MRFAERKEGVEVMEVMEVMEVIKPNARSNIKSI